MNQPMQNPYPPKVQDELARERNHIAANRSLLSFVRNSLTLISAGVTLDHVVRALSPDGRYIDSWAYGLSLLFTGLGVLNLRFATLDYQAEIRRLRAPEYHFTPRWSLGSLTGWTLLVVGLGVFGWLVVEVFR
jgi:putative membrane protein